MDNKTEAVDNGIQFRQFPDNYKWQPASGFGTMLPIYNPAAWIFNIYRSTIFK